MSQQVGEVLHVRGWERARQFRKCWIPERPKFHRIGVLLVVDGIGRYSDLVWTKIEPAERLSWDRVLNQAAS